MFMSILNKFRGNKSKTLKIIIVGTGKVGSTIAGKLTEEGCDVTVVDKNREVVEKLAETLWALWATARVTERLSRRALRAPT